MCSFIQKLLTEHVLCRVRARVFIVNQTDSFLSPESLQLRWEVDSLTGAYMKVCCLLRIRHKVLWEPGSKRWPPEAGLPTLSRTGRLESASGGQRSPCTGGPAPSNIWKEQTGFQKLMDGCFWGAKSLWSTLSIKSQKYERLWSGQEN